VKLMATKAPAHDLLDKLRGIARAVGEAHIALEQGDGDACIVNLNDAELRVRAARDELMRAELRSGLSSTALAGGWLALTTLH
jgi:hypothetical protein